MRVAFSLAITCFAAFYTSLAFSEYAFLSQAGRLGPGFFPRVIGVGLLAIALYNLYLDFKSRDQDDSLSAFWGVTIVVALLNGALVIGMEVLGGLLAMILFMLVSLFILNRRQMLVNLALAVIFPLGIYMLFRGWLQAAMPDGMLNFGI